jgi:hypothetical protein
MLPSRTIATRTIATLVEFGESIAPRQPTKTDLIRQCCWYAILVVDSYEGTDTSPSQRCESGHEFADQTRARKWSWKYLDPTAFADRYTDRPPLDGEIFGARVVRHDVCLEQRHTTAVRGDGVDHSERCRLSRRRQDQGRNRSGCTWIVLHLHDGQFDFGSERDRVEERDAIGNPNT